MQIYSIVERGGEEVKGEFILYLGNTKNVHFRSPLTQM